MKNLNQQRNYNSQMSRNRNYNSNNNNGMRSNTTRRKSSRFAVGIFFFIIAMVVSFVEALLEEMPGAPMRIVTMILPLVVILSLVGWITSAVIKNNRKNDISVTTLHGETNSSWGQESRGWAGNETVGRAASNYGSSRNRSGRAGSPAGMWNGKAARRSKQYPRVPFEQDNALRSQNWPPNEGFHM